MTDGERPVDYPVLKDGARYAGGRGGEGDQGLFELLPAVSHFGWLLGRERPSGWGLCPYTVEGRGC